MRITNPFRKKKQTPSQDFPVREELKTSANSGGTRWILCLDGGGMRGVIPVRILMELKSCLEEAGLTERPEKYFDLVAGTSTGALIALALTCTDMSLEQLMDTYRTCGPIAFPRESRGLGQALRTLTSEKYPASGIESLIRKWYGDRKLGDADVRTMIMAYNVLSGEEAELCSWENPEFSVFDAARATSAAPTYYSPHQVGNMLLVDGGVIANNPSLFAVSRARQIWPDCREFVVVSIGTAGIVHTMAREGSSGILNWLDNIVPLYSNAQKRTVDRLLEATPDVRYVRIESQMAESINMDDCSPSAIAMMEKHGEWLAGQYRERLTSIARRLALRRTE